MRETWVRSLGQQDPLEKEVETHSSILAWESHGQRSLAGYNGKVGAGTRFLWVIVSRIIESKPLIYE